MKQYIAAGLILILIIGGGLAFLTASASGEQIEETHVHGISTRGTSVLQIAVTDRSLTAYPVIDWYVYAPLFVHASHLVDDGLGAEPVSMDLEPGLHVFTMEYEVGTQTIVWIIGSETFEFVLRITDRAIVEAPEHPSDWILVSPNALSDLELEVALGALLAAMLPSIFIIPFWKSRKEEGYENAFD